MAKVAHALGQTGSLTEAQVRDVFGYGPGRVARAARPGAAGGAVDRVKDRIVPGAFEKTIAQWRASGKRIPVHWDHRGDAANVIGSIDPAPSAS